MSVPFDQARNATRLNLGCGQYPKHGFLNIDINPLFCIGTTAELTARLREYVAVGASKFVLFPIANGEQDMVDQTRRVIEEVKPLIENR